MQVSPAATEVARRHWACAAGDTGTVEGVAATAGRTCTQLQAGLARWVGTEGYRALLHRALLLARAEHPALGSLSCHGEDEPVNTAAVRAHSAAEVATGMVALVAALVELLGRILGEEMAVRLVEQSGMQNERESARGPERPRKTEPARSREH
jgi:hypothetical protein